MVCWVMVAWLTGGLVRAHRARGEGGLMRRGSSFSGRAHSGSMSSGCS